MVGHACEEMKCFVMLDSAASDGTDVPLTERTTGRPRSRRGELEHHAPIRGAVIDGDPRLGHVC